MDEPIRLIRAQAARQELSVEDYARCRLPFSELGQQIIRAVAEAAFQERSAREGPHRRDSSCD